MSNMFGALFWYLEPVSSNMFCFPAMAERVTGCLEARTSFSAPSTNLLPAWPIITRVGEPIKEVLNTNPCLDILSSNQSEPRSPLWARRKLNVSPIRGYPRDPPGRFLVWRLERYFERRKAATTVNAIMKRKDFSGFEFCTMIRRLLV